MPKRSGKHIEGASSIAISNRAMIPEGVASPIAGVSADGKRFLAITKAEGNVLPNFNALLNWQQAINK